MGCEIILHCSWFSSLPQQTANSCGESAQGVAHFASTDRSVWGVGGERSGKPLKCREHRVPCSSTLLGDVLMAENCVFENP